MLGTARFKWCNSSQENIKRSGAINVLNVNLFFLLRHLDNFRTKNSYNVPHFKGKSFESRYISSFSALNKPKTGVLFA